MQTTRRALTALVAVLLFAFAVAACGSDEKESSGGATTPASDGKAIQADPANEGKTFTVGSKNFDEQYILGEIYAQALEAAGFTVERKLDLGSEQVAFKGLKSGEVDAYPEYVGTALTSFLRVKTSDISADKTKSYEALKAGLTKEDITALPPTPFQNTFVITTTPETDKKLGSPKTVSELAKKAGSKTTISGFPECRQRTDCLLGLKNTYNWSPKFVSSNGKYADLDQGQADLTFGFGTDGEQLLDKYVHNYEDDKKLFPPYYISFLVSKKGVATLGKSGEAVIAKVQEPLTEKVMQELNSRVSIDKEKPANVAADFLKAAGFVK